MIKASNKELKSIYYTISTGYCNLQYLLDGGKKIYYNSGVYGWNWSAYVYGRYAIVDGYRNFPKDDIFIDREKMSKYNDIGAMIDKKYMWTDKSEKRAELKEKLVYRLIRETKRG